MIRIEAEKALKMTEQEMLDVVFKASENSVIELNVVDPDLQAGDNDGVYLEVVKLDEHEVYLAVVKLDDEDGDRYRYRYLVGTDDIYAIYRALVDQVEEVA